MDNMITYVKHNFRSFEECPPGEVDSLVLTWLSYLNLECLDDLSRRGRFPIKEIYRAEKFDELLFNVKCREDTLELLSVVAASPRFRNVTVFGYRTDFDPETHKQFAAMSFRLTDNLTYLAFRGTDCTLAGWKEDMFLALEEPVPSQRLSVKYVEEIASKVPGPLILGGHSKGGNLAVYGAAMCCDEIQRRISDVYTHDGPGFLPCDLEQPGFARIRDRIHKTLPQASVFGLLFMQECEYEIIQSNAVSVAQHAPFSWEVKDDMLVRRDNLSADGRRLYRKINNWAGSIDSENRAKFINGIFEILDETGVRDFNEFGADLPKYVPIILHKIHSMDHDMQRFLIHTLHLLAATDPEDISDHQWEELTKEGLPE